MPRLSNYSKRIIDFHRHPIYPVIKGQPAGLISIHTGRQGMTGEECS